MRSKPNHSDKSVSGLVKVGLTGGIGAGKSTVRRLLAAAGFPTIDADSLAKTIANDDARARQAIVAAFGEAVYSESGQLQRQVLAEKVFGNRPALQKLNSILHPLVFEAVDAELARREAEGKRCVIIEAALFYESGWDRQMDLMVVVDAPLGQRLAWLQARDQVTAEQIHARIANQLPVEEKVRRADYVIDNTGRLEDLRHEVERFIAWLNARLQSHGDL